MSQHYKDLPVLEELDTEPTLDELNKAIDALSCGKAPGEDCIPPEIIKAGKPALIKPLHKLLSLLEGGSGTPGHA